MKNGLGFAASLESRREREDGVEQVPRPFDIPALLTHRHTRPVPTTNSRHFSGKTNKEFQGEPVYDKRRQEIVLL